MSLADLILNHVSRPSLPSFLTRYENGRTPLSTWTPVVLALAAYLVVIFSVQEVMRPRKPLKLTALFQLHNLILSSGSFVLLVLMVEEIAPIVYNRGIFYGICGEEAWTSRLEFYYMINYYFKYIELLDTLFLVLKKKPLAFLHVFHHSSTTMLCYLQLNHKPSVAWVPITLNLSVHVFMYYYFYATAGGRRIWWKKYLTSMQITQFVIDVFVVYFAGYSHFSAIYFPSLPTLGTCAGRSTGSVPAATFACGLLTSYLFLFISFYKSTYMKPQMGKGGLKANGSSNDVAVNDMTEHSDQIVS